MTAKKFLTWNLFSATICLVGFLLVTASFYPGYISPDTVTQLYETRKFSFAGLHPPIMGFVWHFIDLLLPGPGGMLIFHQLMLWLGLYLLCSSFRPNNKALFVLPIVLLFFIPSLIITTTIWKDVGCATAIILALGLVTRGSVIKNRLLFYLSFPPLVYAALVRYNSIIALAPLLVGILLLWRHNFSKPITMMKLLCLAAFFTLVGVIINVIFTKSLVLKNSYAYQQILLHDLAGISIKVKKNLIPNSFYVDNKPIRPRKLRKYYSPLHAYFLMFSPGAPFKTSTYQPQIKELQLAWLRAVRENPLVYLAHRWHTFKAQIGYGFHCDPYHPSCHAGVSEATVKDLGITFKSDGWDQVIMRFYSVIKLSYLYKAWIYICTLLLYLLVLVFSPKNIWNNFALTITISGLLYSSAYFFIGVSCDFRMHLWTTCCTSLSPWLYIQGLLSQKSTTT